MVKYNMVINTATNKRDIFFYENIRCGSLRVLLVVHTIYVFMEKSGIGKTARFFCYFFLKEYWPVYSISYKITCAPEMPKSIV